MGNKFDQKALEDKAFEDAKNNNFNLPHSTNVFTDIANGLTPAYDKEYIENHEYGKLYEEAKESISKYKK